MKKMVVRKFFVFFFITFPFQTPNTLLSLSSSLCLRRRRSPPFPSAGFRPTPVPTRRQTLRQLCDTQVLLDSVVKYVDLFVFLFSWLLIVCRYGFCATIFCYGCHPSASCEAGLVGKADICTNSSFCEAGSVLLQSNHDQC